ncbi:MAG: hypothetical protein ACLVJ6_12420 [Merdibacter sp.]
MISEEARRFISAHKDILMDTITAIRGGRTCVLVKVSEKNSTRGSSMARAPADRRST